MLFDPRNFMPLPRAYGRKPDHYNRYRIYFTRSGTSTAELAEDFRANFPAYFNPRNIAQVQWGHRQRAGCNATLRFTFDANGPNLHDDWVNVCYIRSHGPMAGFAAQTLRRLWRDAKDNQIAAVGLTGSVAVATAATLTTGPVGTAAGITVASGMMAATEFGVLVNQHHFLAGRRSWMICRAIDEPGVTAPHAVSPDLYFLETAALERFALVWFKLMELYEISWLMTARPWFKENIDILWSTLLRNYVSLTAAKVARDPGTSSWCRDAHIVRGVYWAHPTGTRPIAEIEALHPALKVEPHEVGQTRWG